MFCVLHAVPHHGHSHHHHHHHSHSEAELVVDAVSGHNHACPTSTNQNINIRAAVIHVTGDFCQSIGVLLAAILIKIKVKRSFSPRLLDKVAVDRLAKLQTGRSDLYVSLFGLGPFHHLADHARYHFHFDGR